MAILKGSRQSGGASLTSFGVAALLLLSPFGGATAPGQSWTSVTAIGTLSTSNTPLTRTGIQGDTGSYTVTYDGFEQYLYSLVAGGIEYEPFQYGYATARRNTAVEAFPTNNADQSVQFNAVATTTGAGDTNHTVRGRYINDLSALFTSSNILTGTENLFVNTSQPGDVVSNIERMDFLFTNGIVVASDRGFALFERGRGPNSPTAGANGGFKVAAITAIDSFGNPTGFSTTVVSIADNAYNNGNVGVGHPGYRYDVLRYATNGGPELNYMNNAALSTQGMAAAFIYSTGFGLSTGTTIYGYAVFGEDVTGTGNDLIDVTNPIYFPNNSTIANDVDMISAGAIFFTEVPETNAWFALALAAAVAIALRRRR